LKKLLSGLTIPQQYVCISLEDFPKPLCVYASGTGDNNFVDVTHTHLFIGYRPLIVAIVFSENLSPLASEDIINLSFVHDSMPPFFDTKGERVAKLAVSKIATRTLDAGTIVFYEGVIGTHRFLSRFHQFVNSQRERLRRDTPGNVSLPGNLHDQVRIAYSIPRIIALITVSDNGHLNMFPTDLHGPCGSKFYISSLRHGGKASQQLDSTRKLVLAFMPVEEFRMVYALGKNHMRDMQDLSGFDTLSEKSTVLQLPVPASALRYKELEVLDSFDRGIHRVYVYRVVGEKHLKEGKTLAHIHQYYAQWRTNRTLQTDMYLR
jgi:flavin reductase (DIM6/NTAB) family NADH-FMN oxidoreductase RutF